MFIFYGLKPIFQIRRKFKFEPDQIFQYQSDFQRQVVHRHVKDTHVGMEFRSHDFDEVAFYFHLLSYAQTLSFFYLISSFCTDGIFDTLSGSLEPILPILSTQYNSNYIT